MKDNEIHALLKVPDKAIIKELRVERGKANAYIQELEEEIRKLTSISPADRKTFKKEKVFNEYREKITQLNKIISKLRKDNELLLIKSIKNN